MRIPALMAALLALVAAVSTPGHIQAAGGTEKGSATYAYLQGLSHVMREFIAANSGVLKASADLARHDSSRAVRDLGRTITQERKARADLRALAVPRKAVRVQRLLLRAMNSFVSGAVLMRQGASRTNMREFQSGLSRYYRGDMLLKQAYGLIVALRG